MLEVTPLCGSGPTIVHQPDEMEANTGNKGRQAILCFTQNSAHINLETAGMEENVPIESGTSSQEETGVGRKGMALQHSFGSILGLSYFRTARCWRHLTRPKPNGCVFHATQSNCPYCRRSYITSIRKSDRTASHSTSVDTTSLRALRQRAERAQVQWTKQHTASGGDARSEAPAFESHDHREGRDRSA